MCCFINCLSWCFPVPVFFFTFISTLSWGDILKSNYFDVITSQSARQFEFWWLENWFVPGMQSNMELLTYDCAGAAEVTLLDNKAFDRVFLLMLFSFPWISSQWCLARLLEYNWSRSQGADGEFMRGWFGFYLVCVSTEISLLYMLSRW